MEEEEKEARSQENLQKLGFSPGSGLAHAGTMGIGGAMVGSAAGSAEIKKEIEAKGSLPFFSESEHGSLSAPPQPLVVNVEDSDQIGKVRIEETDEDKQKDGDAFEADAFEGDAFDGDAFDAEPKKPEEPEPTDVKIDESVSEVNQSVDDENKAGSEKGDYHGDDELKVVLTQELHKEAVEVAKQEEEKMEEKVEEQAEQTEEPVMVAEEAPK